jgi:hypothetical protein
MKRGHGTIRMSRNDRPSTINILTDPEISRQFGGKVAFEIGHRDQGGQDCASSTADLFA